MGSCGTQHRFEHPSLGGVAVRRLDCLPSLAVFQSISPVDGTVSGGTVVTLAGTDFEQLHPSNTTVFFGDIQCSLLWWVCRAVVTETVLDP